jgi:hypothetical protein
MPDNRGYLLNPRAGNERSYHVRHALLVDLANGGLWQSVKQEKMARYLEAREPGNAMRAQPQ